MLSRPDSESGAANRRLFLPGSPEQSSEDDLEIWVRQSQ
jgi:hypothetical protein